MGSEIKRRFSIRFDGWYAVLSSALGLLPSSSYVDVQHDVVNVRMGWAFRARFARSSVESAEETGERPISRGVHGLAGRWLVNGSSDRIVTITLRSKQGAYVMGFPVRLRALMVSVEEPGELVDLLTR